jgi:hypothetical protein
MTWEKIRNSWEIRSLLWIGRFFLASAFLLYLLLAAPAAWTWAQTEWVRRHEVAELENVIKKSLEDGKISRVSKWISMRPLAETEEISHLIEPHSGELESFLFAELAGRYTKLGDMEKAAFWYQYVRFRVRFDTLRCGSPDSVETMAAIFSLFPNEEVRKAFEADPDLVKRSVKQVLDFDALHPANNDPADTCGPLNDMGGTRYVMLEKNKWKDVRFTLRWVTDQFLQEAKEP